MEDYGKTTACHENEKDWNRAAVKLRENESVVLIKLQFADLFGRLKTVEMTRDQFINFSTHGYAINRYAAEGMEGKRDVEESAQRESRMLYLTPDPDTFQILPWESGQTDVARFICRISEKDGAHSWADSRNVLDKLIGKAKKMGFTFKFRFQCEFYLFHVDDEGRPTTVTHEAAGYYDAGSIDLAGSVRRDIMLCLEEAGMGVESAHHGMTPGHQILVLPVREGIQAADYLITFKAAVKRIAKSHGLHAAFMPKPVKAGDGSGLHVGILLEADRADQSPGGSPVGADIDEQFKRGVLKHLKELMLFTNPTVNSYTRLTVIHDDTFQPEFPGAVLEKEDSRVRRESREDGSGQLSVLYSDGSANPYLLLAAIVASGLDGIENSVAKSDYIEALDFPESLGEAIREAGKCRFAAENLGGRLCNSYLRGKKDEWDRFLAAVTDWELREYLYRC